MCAKTAEEVRNEQIILLAPFAGGRQLEKHLKFICLFANDRYFYDVGAGRKYFGSEIGVMLPHFRTCTGNSALTCFSDHVYVAVPVLLQRLGVFMNLQASLIH
jgi:hypothetical protein